MLVMGTAIGALLVAWLSWGGYLCWRDRDFWFDYLPQSHSPNPVLYWLVGPFIYPLVMLLGPLLQEPTKCWDVFLCYSHWNCLWASAFYGLARFSGALVFLDYVEIAKEADWRFVAEKGIKETDTLVFLESADSRDSENVQHELSHRRNTYRRRSQAWKDASVPDSNFPRNIIKASLSFESRTGVVTIAVPETPHPSWRYKSPSECSSDAVANIEGWLAVNLPAVVTLSTAIGLPCPPREVLASLMREYLEFAATGNPPGWLRRLHLPY